MDKKSEAFKRSNERNNSAHQKTCFTNNIIQRVTWDALNKSLNGLINKVDMTNLRNILPDIFNENLVRGRGVLVRNIMKAQETSTTFTAVYAALISVINTKFPKIGLLLLKRLLLKMRRSLKRNDKAGALIALQFIGQLVNQRVAHDSLSVEILYMLLEHHSEDSLELGVSFLKEVGAFLQQSNSGEFCDVFEKFRRILQ